MPIMIEYIFHVIYLIFYFPNTVLSFINMVRYLLQQPGVNFILSAKLNQDPLEEYFGKQRSIGRRAENPTAKQFVDNAASMQVTKGAGITVKHGNVKRSLNFVGNLDSPLPKRKRRLK